MPISTRLRLTSGKKTTMATKWSGLSRSLPLPSQIITSMLCALWEEVATQVTTPAIIQTEASVAVSSTQATSQLSQRSMQSGLAKLYTMIGPQLWASLRESMILPTGAHRIPASL